jgi:hypothetical protein
MAKYRKGSSWALNSAVECHPHTVEVIGSNPIAPTINISLPHSHLRVAFSLCLAQFQPDASPT